MPIPSLRPEQATAISAEIVATKAVCRAAEHLGLTQAALARIIGMSEASVSRLRSGRIVLERDSKPFELALLLVRLFRGIDAMTGGDDLASRSWLRTENTALRATPVDLIQKVEGLIAALTYVDARRGIV